VNSGKNSFENKIVSANGRRAVVEGWRLLERRGLVLLGAGRVLLCGLPALGQTQEESIAKRVERNVADVGGAGAAGREQLKEQQTAGAIGGTVVDPTERPLLEHG